MSTRNPGLTCMCGSGRKYNACCMTMDMGRKKRRDESNKITGDMVVFMHAPRFAEALLAARRAFPGDAGQFGDVEHYAFLEWVAHDYILADHGKTMLELFAEDPSRTSREAEVANSMISAPLGIYEITSITRGLCITVRDVFDGSETIVYDKSMSMVTKPSYTVVTRLHEMDGMTILCGLSSPLLDREQARVLKKFVESEARRTGCGGIRECLKKNSGTITIFAHDLSKPHNPTAAAANENLITTTTVHYQLNRSQKEIAGMLHRDKGVMYSGRHQGSEGFMIVDSMPLNMNDPDYFMIRNDRPGNNPDPSNAEMPEYHHVMGIIVISDDELSILCKSDSMARRSKERLVDLLGGEITFVSISKRDDPI